MAVCTTCDREMMGSVLGCTGAVFEFRGCGSEPVKFNPLRHGQETRYCEPLGPEPCHDCGAPIGTFHHPGCDMEECPKCLRQAISCDCLPFNRYEGQAEEHAAIQQLFGRAEP